MLANSSAPAQNTRAPPQNTCYGKTLNNGFEYDLTGKTSKALDSKRAAFTVDYTIRLQHTQIERRDTLRAIRSQDTEDTFFYLDPPYGGAVQGHYDGYTQDDFDALLPQNKRAPPHNNTVAPHNNTVVAHNNTVAAHNNTVAAHNSTVVAHNNTVVAHNNTVAAHNNTVAAHNNTVAAHNNTVVAHNNTVAPHNNTVAAQNKRAPPQNIYKCCL